MTRMAPKTRHFACLLGALLAFVARAATVARFEDPAELATIARKAAAADLTVHERGERLEVGTIAPGLALRRCAGPVTATRAPGLRSDRRVLLELRCAGPSAWHIYVPVQVVGTAEVVVAAHAIVTGTVLTSADLRLQRIDLDALPLGYLDSTSIAVGLTALRPIAGGVVLTNQMLLGRIAVQHGQMVTLVAESGGISVRMSGRALTDGLVNQRVKVENLSSGRIVEGIARPDQTVEIFVP